MLPDKPVLTSGEVAKAFAVSSETVRRWAEENKLRGFLTPSGAWRFQREVVAEFLERAS